MSEPGSFISDLISSLISVIPDLALIGVIICFIIIAEELIRYGRRKRKR